MNVTQRKKRGKKNPLTITAAGRLLGVTREHLSNAINGHVKSPAVLRRFRALKDKHDRATAAESKLWSATHASP